MSVMAKLSRYVKSDNMALNDMLTDKSAKDEFDHNLSKHWSYTYSDHLSISGR